MTTLTATAETAETVKTAVAPMREAKARRSEAAKKAAATRKARKLAQADVVDATVEQVEQTPDTLIVKGRAYHITPYPTGESGLRSIRIECGTTSDYDIDEVKGGRAVCTCPDFRARHADKGTACKHILAAEAAGLISDLRVQAVADPTPVAESTSADHILRNEEMVSPDPIGDAWAASWVAYLAARSVELGVTSIEVSGNPVASNHPEIPDSSLKTHVIIATPPPCDVWRIDTASIPGADTTPPSPPEGPTDGGEGGYDPDDPRGFGPILGPHGVFLFEWMLRTSAEYRSGQTEREEYLRNWRAIADRLGVVFPAIPMPEAEPRNANRPISSFWDQPRRGIVKPLTEQERDAENRIWATKFVALVKSPPGFTVWLGAVKGYCFEIRMDLDGSECHAAREVTFGGIEWNNGRHDDLGHRIGIELTRSLINEWYATHPPSGIS